MTPRFSNRVLARRAMRTGFNVGFTPAFVASLVSYLITDNPNVTSAGGYLQLGLLMLFILVMSFVWAGIALIIVTAGVFISYRLSEIGL